MWELFLPQPVPLASLKWVKLVSCMSSTYTLHAILRNPSEFSETGNIDSAIGKRHVDCGGDVRQWCTINCSHNNRDPKTVVCEILPFRTFIENASNVISSLLTVFQGKFAVIHRRQLHLFKNRFQLYTLYIISSFFRQGYSSYSVLLKGKAQMSW
jgi:hypothetical protein